MHYKPTKSLLIAQGSFTELLYIKLKLLWSECEFDLRAGCRQACAKSEVGRNAIFHEERLGCVGFGDCSDVVDQLRDGDRSESPDCPQRAEIVE